MYTHKWIRANYPSKRLTYRGKWRSLGTVSGFSGCCGELEIWDHEDYYIKDQDIWKRTHDNSEYPVTKTVEEFVCRLPYPLRHVTFESVVLGECYDLEGFDLIVTWDVAERLDEIHDKVSELADEFFQLAFRA